MRLAILERGHGFGTKAFFAFIRTVSRQPVPDVLKLMMYRPDFFGNNMKAITHEAMRGPSAWSVGDRELMAATVSTVNASEYCIKAHTATSAKAYQDPAKTRSGARRSRDGEYRGTAASHAADIAKADERTHGERGRYALGIGCWGLARTDRGCARSRLRIQHDQSSSRCFRIRRAGRRSVRSRREVLACARLPLTSVRKGLDAA